MYVSKRVGPVGRGDCRLFKLHVAQYIQYRLTLCYRGVSIVRRSLYTRVAYIPELCRPRPTSDRGPGL